MGLARDLLHPTLAEEKRKCKLKRLVPSPNSYFMDVKCADCLKIQVVFSHAQTPVVCPGCDRILCTPTGGKTKLTFAYISEVFLEQTSPFPIELGNRIEWKVSPKSGNAYDSTGGINIFLEDKLTKQPTFLDLSLTLEREPDYVKYAPPELLLAPPTFLDGSMARLECKTDGALPPAPISFSIVCDNPPRATVELDRQSKAQIGHPYEISYAYYHFRSPPTDEELAERIAIRNARSIIEESRIARSQDNLTLSVSLPVNSRAHDCSLYCRLMGKERQVRLTVYYQTTVAYILPSPTDGLMRVGSSVTCYADGYPEPSISLSLRQPMHQYQRRPIIDPKEYIVTTSPSPPVDEFEDKSDVAVATRIGLRPDEYTIRGARFSLAYNATPGVELLLVCSAGNALPNSLNFLGYNKTIAVARFTVAAISYSSIGIVVGICLSILLVAILVILLMIYLRRRQKYASNATHPKYHKIPQNSLL
ncbi:unnamed protein product [Mesocestoides corti]|uniref:40S ribosomal protein S27 n=2 Tax=Mesocestoides corti TaxID=53468 RepID=A0A0R3UQE9_MESCO|nr:unnamed protein product [Mesocestoides corti]